MNKFAKPKVLLIVPPFQTTAAPALGVSQLKANLAQAGFPTTVLYLNFYYAARIGIEAYEWISEQTISTLLGEYIFSRVLFPDFDSSVEHYAKEILAGSTVERDMRVSFPKDSPRGDDRPVDFRGR